MVPAPTRAGIGPVSGPASSSSNSGSGSNFVGRASKKAVHKERLRNNNNVAPTSPPPKSDADTRLEKLASSLPQELIGEILEFAAETASTSRFKLNLLLLSMHYNERLAPYIYSTVALCSSSAIHAFSALAKAQPKVARYVKRLWIGPDDSSSDLITALSPPAYNEANYITQMREQVHFSVRSILRCCRKLQDVALAGELLSLHAAHTYGTACQPVRLTSINPHSFVGEFSAPIFRKVKILRIVDTNLAFEEADEIRTLAELEWLIWSSPKDYGDITRDSNVLRRLLQRPRRHLMVSNEEEGEPTRTNNASSEVTADGPAGNAEGDPNSTATEDTAASSQRANQDSNRNDHSIIDALWTDLSSLELSEGLAPARPSRNDKFRRLTIQTAHNRCEEFRRLLAGSYPLFVSKDGSAPSSGLPHKDRDEERYEDGLTAGLDASFADLDREWDPAFNIPTIHPTSLSGMVLDEWDALRDLINNAAGQYSNLSMFDEGEQSAIVDAGNALRRQRRVWEQMKDIGLPG